jgi:hypothetical protein
MSAVLDATAPWDTVRWDEYDSPYQPGLGVRSAGGGAPPRLQPTERPPGEKAG